jgi:predicted TIM-barrel fold metal-dependent hydrolase
MIIDAHAHLVAPNALYVYKANLHANGGAHGKGGPGISDDQLRASAEENVAIMDSVGTDVQLLSPRPYMLMHSERPPKIVRWWCEWNNDLIARTVELFPERFRGVAALPQSPYTDPSSWLDEVDRCVGENGFVGVLLNPDPFEGAGESPPLGDPFWYPVYEKLCELDVPALIHSAGCRNDRESYSEHFVTEESIAVLSLTKTRVFLDFPDLKIVVSHGGGSVPYQIGRWRAARQHARLGAADQLREPFEDSLRRLWFDTVLHEKASLELLFRVVGTDRCLFGTEKPGSGTAKDPATGRDFDDLKATIEEIDWLSDEDRSRVFEGNARSLYRSLPGKA